MIQKDIDIDLDPFPNNIKNENDIFKIVIIMIRHLKKKMII